MSLHSRPVRPRWLLVSIYSTQYIGVAFILAAAVAILRESGMELKQLALLKLIAIPIAGKIFYAPFIDRFRLFFKGKYRSWLIFSQLVMALLLFYIGLMDIHQNFNTILLLLIIYTLATSIQDVAIDGLTCKVFAENDRQLANSLQYGSNLLGNIIGGGIILMLYPWLQWQGALWLLAGLTLISWLQIIVFREPELSADAQPDLKQQKMKAIIADAVNFVRQNRYWFFLLLLYPIGFSAGFSILNPILVDSGWSLSSIGFATQVIGSLIGICSAFFATYMMNRLGRKNTLVFLTFAQAASLMLLLPVSVGYTSTLFVYIAILGYNAISPALLATLATMAMDRTAYSTSKATVFTLQTSLMVFIGFIYSALSLVVAQYVGYTMDILLIIALTFVLACVVWKTLPTVKMGNKVSERALD
ncbi:MFS transporter [Acinetobacter sp. WZC-1]|uniref:MFS transporter n=1 Tax=Acinetobacter sp. WZC-1 TaxID=3459034 RepID=UPI00403D7DBE